MPKATAVISCISPYAIKACQHLTSYTVVQSELISAGSAYALPVSFFSDLMPFARVLSKVPISGSVMVPVYQLPWYSTFECGTLFALIAVLIVLVSPNECKGLSLCLIQHFAVGLLVPLFFMLFMIDASFCPFIASGLYLLTSARSGLASSICLSILGCVTSAWCSRDTGLLICVSACVANVALFSEPLQETASKSGSFSDEVDEECGVLLEPSDCMADCALSANAVVRTCMQIPAAISSTAGRKSRPERIQMDNLMALD